MIAPSGPPKGPPRGRRGPYPWGPFLWGPYAWDLLVSRARRLGAWLRERSRHREWRVGSAVAVSAVIVVAAVLVAGPGHLPLPGAEPPSFALTPQGDEVHRLSPITVTFAKPPAERMPQQLLRVEPAPRGTYAWVSARTLLFQPDFPGLLRGSTYTIQVPARPEAGLAAEVTRQFTVAGQLTVQHVIPGDGDVEVPLNAQLLVQFSRSVAPLTTLSAQRTEPVLGFDPPLAGKGEWLNTSIYRFVPSDLRPTTSYRLKVAKGLSSAADGVLQDDFRWSFSTISPAVDAIAPDDNTQFAAPDQRVVVTFNQPMERSASAVNVRHHESGARVPGTIAWSDDGRAATFTPSVRLGADQVYIATTAKGLKGARGGETTAERSASFRTVGVPRVTETHPKNGETDAGRFGVNLLFAHPMDRESLEDKLSISGFTKEDLEGNVFAHERGMSASVALRPRTRYTVTLAAGAKDRYGQAMGAYSWSFTTGAVPSSVSLGLPGGASYGTYSATREPVIYFQATNTPTASFILYPLTADEARVLFHDFGRRAYPFTPSRPALRTWSETVSGAADEAVLGSTSLSGGGPLAKGFYFLRTGGSLRSEFAFAVVDAVIVTKLSNDELLAWVLDHDTGQPIGGVPIAASGPGVTSPVETDENGLASFKVPRPIPGLSIDRSYFLTLEATGRHALTSTRWQHGVSPYQVGVQSEFFAREWVAHVYSDRPIYRPGEAVEFKGVIRADDDASYSIPPADAPLEVVIVNARGQEVRKEAVRPNDFGTFAGRFELPGDSPLGNGFIRVQLRGSTSAGHALTIATSTFRVAEFRKPEFEVSVRRERAHYIDGQTIDARTSAAFFFGGAVAGAPVAWSARSDPEPIRVPGYQRYSFGDDDRSRQAVVRDPLRGSGTATTDAAGQASFAVPAALRASEGTQRFTLSATVSDLSGQAVAGSATVTVHPADLYAGIRPAQYLASAGAAARIELVTVDIAGNVLPGRPVTVKVYERQWITTKEQYGGERRYKSEPRDTLIDTQRATTGDDGEASVLVLPRKPGTLRLVAEVTDARGRVARSATFLWVSGSGIASWRVTNDDTIALVADKDRYEVGDTAEVLVPAPFAGATGLVTVERGKVITRSVQPFPTGSERLRIPITDRSLPNVFVSVVLYRAPTATDPVPRYKVGYAQLPVSTSTRVLNVAIKADRAQARPGDTVHYDLRVSDVAGKGVKAELSLAVVDKAVLALEEERGPNGLRAFWFERGLGVNTGSSMGISMDRWNDVWSGSAKQMKGGATGGGQQQTGFREDFRNTAYWSAQVATREDGTAGVDVTLPDSLTTWRMQARAISGDTMVGEDVYELVTTRPLLLRPALPRFLRVGDSADLRVLVTNSTAADSDVEVTLEAEGLRVEGARTRSAKVAAGRTVAVSWPATVDAEGTAKISFSATGSGDLSDAVRQVIPIHLDVTPETTATGGIVTAHPALETIYLPPFARLQPGSLSVSVQSALAGSMGEELTHLAPREREGVERAASRLIATIGVRRAERSGGATSSAHDGAISRDVASIVGRQRPDGAWAWCDDPVCSSDPNVTGWALLALGEARFDGMAIDQNVVTRASQYVFGHVNRVRDVIPPADREQKARIAGVPASADPDQKAFLLAALASAGGGDGVLTASRALFEQYRAALSSWGRAYLILALAADGTPADDPVVRSLLNDLSAGTIPDANGNHWEVPRESGTFMTSTATTALVALALARVQPQHALLPQSVRWLVVARGAERWQTSIDRAMSILGLTTYAVRTGELGGDFSYKVMLATGAGAAASEASEVLTGVVRPGQSASSAKRSVPLTTLKPGVPSTLAFERDYARPGRLYYTLNLRYVTPAQEIEALNRGLAISREYTLLEDPSRPVTTARLGDTVRVKMTIVAPADRNYVTVQDLLPAGLEAIDVRARNVDPGLKAKLEADRAAAAQRKAGGYQAPWFRWYYSPWQWTEVRDDRAVLYTERLPKGVYEHVYYARATTPGDFFVAPAHAEQAYFPDVFGRSDSSRFVVGR